MLEIHLVLVFMIVAAIIAVKVKDLLSSVVAIGAVGIGLSMAFLLLKAPDLAITQLVVEILALIVLIRATKREDLPFSSSGRWIFNTISTISFIGVFLFLAYLSLKNLPQFGTGPMRVSEIYLKEGMKGTGLVNIVEAIVLNFRSYDTLGEITIFFTTVIGVLAIARRVAHEKGSKDA